MLRYTLYKLNILSSSKVVKDQSQSLQVVRITPTALSMKAVSLNVCTDFREFRVVFCQLLQRGFYLPVFLKITVTPVVSLGSLVKKFVKVACLKSSIKSPKTINV